MEGLSPQRNSERRWGTRERPLPLRWIGDAPPRRDDRDAKPFNFSAALKRIVADVVQRVPLFSHIDPNGLLYAATMARTAKRSGLLASITPLRFEHGQAYRQSRGRLYQIQRFYLDGRELMYVFTCCLPRFLDQSFEEKWITIFHEMFHIGPKFDGDLRRHEGRCRFHTHSKKQYDAAMGRLVRPYLAEHPQPELFAWLHDTFAQLQSKHGGLYAIKVPRPRIVPVDETPRDRT